MFLPAVFPFRLRHQEHFLAFLEYVRHQTLRDTLFQIMQRKVCGQYFNVYVVFGGFSRSVTYLGPQDIVLKQTPTLDPEPVSLSQGLGP